MAGKAYSAAVLTGLIALGAGFYQYTKLKPSKTPFISLGHPDLFRQRDFYDPLPQLLPAMPVDTYLVKIGSGSDYALIDAGCPDYPQASDIAAAVREIIKDGKLRFILLTHGHVDHVGATPLLVSIFPGVQVVMHELEAPYVSGGQSYVTVPSEMPYKYTVAGITISVAPSLPPPRVLVVKGKQGDLSTATGEAGEPPKWPIPEGVLSYYHIPGHSPGQLAWTHIPTGKVFGGDIFEKLLDQEDKPALTLTWPIFTANFTKARESAIDFALNAEYTHIYPGHDVTDDGATKEEVLAFAKDLQATGGPDPFSRHYAGWTG